MNTKKYYKVFFFDEETKTISAQGNATFEVGRVYDKNLPLEKLENYTQAYDKFKQLKTKIKKIANSQNVILFNQIDESVLTKEQLQNLYQYRSLQMLLNSAYGTTKSNK